LFLNYLSNLSKVIITTEQKTVLFTAIKELKKTATYIADMALIKDNIESSKILMQLKNAITLSYIF